MAATKYYSIDLAYDDKAVGRYLDTVDVWPTNDWWRNDPLSDKSIIRPNVAGYRPYARYKQKFSSAQKDPWGYAWYIPCSSKLPASKEYKSTKEIILYR
jgi:hypothetical protein